MSHSIHQFKSGEESKNVFMSYAPDGLYCFNTMVVETAAASSECHERLRWILKDPPGMTQI